MFRRYLRRLRKLGVPKKKSPNYIKYKETARALIIARIQHFAPLCGVVVGRVAIRDQKSRWGSCSAHGNLNFNYKLLLLPTCLRDYVIVHELCHLKELNHRAAFWSLVEAQIPDYKERIIELRKSEIATRMLPTLIVKYSSNHSCGYCTCQNSASSELSDSVIISSSHEKNIRV